MVKIRFPRNSTMAQRAVIQICIDKTSLKFDNNIVANRFEQTTITTHEVTIKCVSSRGKGAKRGASGRRTTSCCWHVWGTFFDELFAHCSDIVIIAQGNRITATSGNWVDRSTFLDGHDAHESEMCDCEENGWVRETELGTNSDNGDEETDLTHAEWIAQQNAISAAIVANEPVPLSERCCVTCRYSCTNPVNNNRSLCPGGRCMHEEGQQLWEPRVTIPEPVVTPTAGFEHRCDSSCRHSRSNNHGTPCTRDCLGSGNPDWEPQRHCCTCKFSSVNNTSGHLCDMTSTCPERDGFPRWELFVRDVPVVVDDPTPMSERRCAECVRSASRANQPPCPHSTACLVDDDHRLFERYFPTDFEDASNTACSKCKFQPNHHGNGHYCPYNTQNRCLIDGQHRCFVRWVEPVTTVRKSCDTCRYSVVNGHKNCYVIVGLCVGCSKWQPLIVEEEIDTTPYLQQPSVMPEEKPYVSFGEVE